MTEPRKGGTFGTTLDPVEMGRKGGQVRAKQLRSDSEIDTILLTLLRLGSLKRTSEALAEVDIKISPETLRQWRNGTWTDKFQTRLAELATIHASELEEEVIVRSRQVAHRASEVQQRAMDVVEHELEAGEPQRAHYAASAAKSLGQMSGAALNALMLMTGRPTERKALTAEQMLGPGRRPGEVNWDDIPDAEVVEDEPKQLEGAGDGT